MSSLLVHPHYSTQDSWRGTGVGKYQEQRERGLPRAAADTQGIPCFTGGLPTPPATRMMHVAPLAVQPHSYGTHYTDSFSSNSRAHQHVDHTSRIPQQYTKPSASTYGGIAMPADDRPVQQPEIASHLQIPESVNKSKGSLAEFAAEIASLFWFETADTLDYAESLPLDAFPDRGLSADAIPSPGFRKWVTTILSTTQVGKNVILLGLLFIYRLKQFNPGVSGKRGSEFRLLTIALMLGNKFLDDNTYTNKTWAEVSGISVTEIHIMEVEFLSNMRYDLYVSAEEWEEWKVKLGRLGSFYEKASRMRSSSTPAPLTPTSHNSPHKLPSPPSTHSAYSHMGPSTGSYHQLPNPVVNAPHLNSSPSRHQRYSSVDVLDSRKRSLDLSDELPPAKRLHHSPQHLPVPNYAPNNVTTSIPPQPWVAAPNTVRPDMPRLPVPRAPATANITQNQLAPLNLPATRAMASVVAPSNGTSWSHGTPAVAQSHSATPINPGLGEIPRIHSHSNSTHTSPNGHGPALPGLSPSYFLTNRSSPYRPVRNVNTLLIPPPSAALHNHVRNVGLEQMHYQPLSKVSSERFAGPVPYNKHDPWHQSNTPLTLKYPHHF
jgi:hypothetical protein